MVKKIQTLTLLIITGLLIYFPAKYLLLETSDLVLIGAYIFSFVMLYIVLFMLLGILTSTLIESLFTKKEVAGELPVIVKDKNTTERITRHMMPVGKVFVPIRRKVKIYNTIVEDKEGMIHKFEGEDIYDTFKIGDSAKITIIEYKIGQEIFTTERKLTYNGNYNK